MDIEIKVYNAGFNKDDKFYISLTSASHRSSCYLSLFEKKPDGYIKLGKIEIDIEELRLALGKMINY